MGRNLRMGSSGGRGQRHLSDGNRRKFGGLVGGMRLQKNRFVLNCVAFVVLTGVALVGANRILAQAPATTGASAAPAAGANDQLKVADLKAMPRTTVSVHNEHSKADETYTGVRLADLLVKLGAPLGHDLRGAGLAGYVVATGSDGYVAVIALAEVDTTFHSGEVIVADTMNGVALDEKSGPFKLVVTEDKRPARWVRNLVSLELKSAKQ